MCLEGNKKKLMRTDGSKGTPEYGISLCIRGIANDWGEIPCSFCDHIMVKEEELRAGLVCPRCRAQAIAVDKDATAGEEDENE